MDTKNQVSKEKVKNSFQFGLLGVGLVWFLFSVAFGENPADFERVSLVWFGRVFGIMSMIVFMALNLIDKIKKGDI